jgi:signal transduction histidine kinase
VAITVRRFVSGWWKTLLALAIVELLTLGVTVGANLRLPHPHPFDARAYVLLAVAGGAFALHRFSRVGAVLLALSATAGYLLLGYPSDGPIALGIMAALYVSVEPGRYWRSLWLALATFAVFIGGDLLFSGGSRFNLASILGLGWVVAPLAVGHALAAMRQRAADAAEAQTLHRVTEERLRIARELHDVVSHSISVINVQAGVAGHVIDEHPEQAKEALQVIRTTSKEALRELRGILGVLRDVDADEVREPAPGLAQLQVLVDTAARAGLKTRVAVTGAPLPLPPAVDLAAYRIVQEALTNVLRHAGPASAEVTVAYGEKGVVLEVTDDGQSPAGEAVPAGGGHGLDGMRERAAAVGGELEAGSLPRRGFRVTARLPVPDATA